MNVNEIHPAIVQGIYKQAADDILSKIKAALGIEEEAPAIDAASAGLTAGAAIPGAVAGAKGGEALAPVLQGKLNAAASKRIPAIKNRAMRTAGTPKSVARFERAADIAGNKKLMKGVGGAAGGLLSASAMYALSNPRTRAALAKLIG